MAEKRLNWSRLWPLEPAGGGAYARSLELDVSGQQLVEVNGVIRASETVGQGCFTRADNVPAQSPGGSGHEGLERGAYLVFR